jgi:hypothetical protein
VIRKGLIGAGSAALVVLLGRTLAYAEQPSPTARFLEQRAGGPAVPIIALVSLVLGADVAVAVCWLASLAVRERALIERRTAHKFELGRALVLACALAVVTCLAGGLLEAFIHWRAGLGWHGLHCIFGPVHRDLLPIETGLSFIAAAIIAAARHVAAWMRRTFARLGAELPRFVGVTVAHTCVCAPLRPASAAGSAAARAPPVLG